MHSLGGYLLLKNLLVAEKIVEFVVVKVVAGFGDQEADAVKRNYRFSSGLRKIFCAKVIDCIQIKSKGHGDRFIKYFGKQRVFS